MEPDVLKLTSRTAKPAQHSIIPEADVNFFAEDLFRQIECAQSTDRNLLTNSSESSPRFLVVISSWPAPETCNNSVREGINFNASVISAMEPNPSSVP